MDGRSVTGDFERWMEEDSGDGTSLSVGALTGDPEGYVKEVSGDGQLFP